MMHDVFLKLFDGRLIFPPISRPRRILECGFGAASWAVEVAESHPNCQVRQHAGRAGRFLSTVHLPNPFDKAKSVVLQFDPLALASASPRGGQQSPKANLVPEAAFAFMVSKSRL